MINNSSNEIKFKYNFTGKNIILTGATGTIGSEVLKQLLEYGAHVIGFIRNKENIPENLNEFIESGMLSFLTIDFNEVNKIKEIFQEAMMNFGGKIDVLIFCHGKFFPGNVSDIGNKEFESNINKRNAII